MSEGEADTARLKKVYTRIESLVTQYQRTYLGLLSVFAFTGYAFVLIFPVLAITSFSNILGLLFAEGDINWQWLLTWFVIMLVAAQISYRIYSTRTIPAVGFTMAESKIPRVYALVNELHAHFKRPFIHRVIITADYELDIVKTPRWMLPVWSDNTLIIGLPLLICLSPRQFEHMMARRIGQFSKQHNMVTNWLYQLRGIWTQYSYIYGKQKNFESKMLKWFYTGYAKLYQTVSVFAARMDELNADRYAMELYIHDDIREMVTVDAACRWYLESRYWPGIEKMAETKSKSPLLPYRKLTTVIRDNLKGEKIRVLKKFAFREVPAWNVAMPSLKARLENIGHDSPFLSENNGPTAAEYYLESSLNGAINLMDKLWSKNHQKKLQKKSLIKKLVPALKKS